MNIEKQFETNMVVSLISKISDSKYFRLLINLKEILSLIVIFILWLSPLYLSPELRIEYQYNHYTSPINTSEAYDSLLNNLDSTIVESEQITTISRFIKSNTFLQVTLENKTNKRIEDIDLKIKNVKQIIDISINTDSSKLFDIKTDLKLNKFTKYNNVKYLTFPNLNHLPPKALIEIYVWGKFNQSAYSPDIITTSSSKSVQILRTAQVAGLPLLISNNLLRFFIVLIVVAGLVGLRRITKE